MIEFFQEHAYTRDKFSALIVKDVYKRANKRSTLTIPATLQQLTSCPLCFSDIEASFLEF
ncbi:Uncharacterised protein [Suttonella ornithocola]|uniref:Uncharacterized protein n=1 Tax=Suttonella ornithocola TaxID=279832 RepID=A0A380MWI1_9GAMM|nr:Uncharacterised protein [Suttonella ornithocola]